MLWCESVAPLGKPVVPLVYWMLIGSSKASVGLRAATASASTGVAGELVPLRAVEVHDGARSAAQPAAHLVDHRAVVAGLERPR